FRCAGFGEDGAVAYSARFDRREVARRGDGRYRTQYRAGPFETARRAKVVRDLGKRNRFQDSCNSGTDVSDPQPCLSPLCYCGVPPGPPHLAAATPVQWEPRYGIDPLVRVQ